MSVYTLMHETNPVAILEISDNTGLDYHIGRVKVLDKSDKYSKFLVNLPRWFESRKLPLYRYPVREALDKCGITSFRDYIRATNLASLRDTFWLKPDDNLTRNTWAEVSLQYKTAFHTKLSDYMLTGKAKSKTFSLAKQVTPEFTSASGILPKAWYLNDKGDLVLRKSGGTFGDKQPKREPYLEYYASQLARALGINAVTYRLVEKDKRVYAESDAYVSIRKGVFPLSYFLPEWADISITMSIIKNNNWHEDFRDMYVLDALLLNTTRNIRDIDIIINNKTLEPVRMAPLTGNLSAVFKTTELDKQSFNSYEFLQVLVYRYGWYDMFDEPFITTLKAIITPRQVDMLRKATTFKFRKHRDYNLPDEVLNHFTRMVQNLAKFYLMELGIKEGR